MEKFIEFTCVGTNEKILIPFSLILHIRCFDDYSFVATESTKNGHRGFDVIEKYDEILLKTLEALHEKS